jgi:hypothetical protein
MCAETPATSAWAETLKPGDPVVPVQLPDPQSEPRSKSAPGQCPDAPDTCHWWDLDAVGAQSSERFRCRHCPEFIWD